MGTLYYCNSFTFSFVLVSWCAARDCNLTKGRPRRYRSWHIGHAALSVEGSLYVLVTGPVRVFCNIHLSLLWTYGIRVDQSLLRQLHLHGDVHVRSAQGYAGQRRPATLVLRSV